MMMVLLSAWFKQDLVAFVPGHRVGWSWLIPPTLSNRSIQCIEQCAVVERLLQKCDRAGTQRSRPRDGLLVCRDEDYRYRRRLCDEPLLEVEAVHARKLYVENGARRPIQVATFDEV